MNSPYLTAYLRAFPPGVAASVGDLDFDSIARWSTNMGAMCAYFVEFPPGASESTLRRRVAYGGRKGRSAARRLARYAVYLAYRELSHRLAGGRL